MKIKNRKLIKVADSHGFVIPIQYTKERMEEGLELGKNYDLEVEEVSSDAE